MAIVPSTPPQIVDRDIRLLLSSMNITHRELGRLYATFQRVRSHDDLTANTAQDECTTQSVLRLVHYHRMWVAKILTGLLELGGFFDAVSWQGFVYVLLKFCSLSRLELSQVMFYIIANDMKSWTVHYLTSQQLEEFYEDYQDCAVESFNTAAINFSCLESAKYRIVDYVELTYKCTQLINPCLHLQRSLKQVIPNMEFWRTYDRLNVMNNLITLDFFRFQKCLTLLELMSAAGKSATSESVAAKQEEMLLQPVKLQENRNPHVAELDGVEWDYKTQIKRKPPIEATLPLPMPGPGPPGWYRAKRSAVRPAASTPPLPAWVNEACLKNCDPLRGTALGEASIPKPPPNWAAPLMHLMTPEEAKDVIEGTQKPKLPQTHGSYQKQKPQLVLGDKKGDLARAKELDFVCKNRKRANQQRPMTVAIESKTVCELMFRPVQRAAHMRKLEEASALLHAGVPVGTMV
jgi:hypothetical protein